MAQAEAAEQAHTPDGLSLPDGIARRRSLKDRLDTAAARLEEALMTMMIALIQATLPGADNLTDPDSSIMGKSYRHE